MRTCSAGMEVFSAIRRAAARIIVVGGTSASRDTKHRRVSASTTNAVARKSPSCPLAKTGSVPGKASSVSETALAAARRMDMVWLL